jgi:hypothetical protein
VTQEVLLCRLHAKGKTPSDRRDFYLAHAILDSRVKPISLRITDLSPDTCGGEFDVVFVGSILNHITDPAGALERIFGITRDLCIVANPVDATDAADVPRMRLVGRSSTGLTTWWLPNLACLQELLWCAGFEGVEVISSDLVLVSDQGARIPHAVLHARKPRDREAALARWDALCK